MVKSNSVKAKNKAKLRVTKEQAAALAALHTKKITSGVQPVSKPIIAKNENAASLGNMSMDAEDKLDKGIDEATEKATVPSTKVAFGSPEWRAKYGKGKSKTVADALSAPGGK